MIAKKRDILNLKYMEAYHSYEKASNEDDREAYLNQMRQFVREAAENEGFHNTIPEQTIAYKLRISRIPMKTVKVYKVFTLSDDGAPTALFISGTEKLPKGVWLDARDAFHFTAKNGNDYVPSTQNPYTDGGKTGASIEIPSEEVRAELIRRGFLPKGSRAKKVTALAYRPGWHAGTLPFFPQGGRKAPKGSPYPMIHRYNQVVFECEIAADVDYTEIARSQKKALTKDGHLNLARTDLQYMPQNGFYYYATNPLTQNNPNLGAWTISGSIKINRALTQEECDVILEDHDMRPQAWEQGILQLDSLGYTGDESEAVRKTLAPITYDDEGNVIPLSQRFNASVQDVRYQERIGSEAIHRVEGLAPSEDEQELKKSLGEDGKRVYEKMASVLSKGNEAVKNAASVGAAILASHAKAWSKAETAAGRKQSAEDYMRSVEVVANAGSTEAEDLGEVVRRWNRLIDEYASSDKEIWRRDRDQEHIPVMKIPLVLQMLDVPFEDIKIFGSFFAHSVNQHTHPGMTLDILRQIPKQIIDPLMVVRGNKPDTYVFVIEVQDNNGATVVVPIEINKEILGQVSSENFINSAYGKTKGANKDQPAFGWFKARIESRDVLYCNKNKSLKYFRSCEGVFPVASELTEALSTFIVSEDFRNVKTEEDLARIKRELPTRYQMAWHGSPYLFDAFDMNHIGSGEGAQSQGYGIYVSRYKNTASFYYESFKKTRGEAHIYKVDIPSTKEMIVSRRSLRSQTPFVKHAIQSAYEDLTKEQRSRYDNAFGASRDVQDPDIDIYACFAWALGDGIRKEVTEEEALLRFVKRLPRPIDGDPQAASLYLKEHGIKGLAYKTYRDGWSYVVFDDEAIRILEREQQRKGVMQGRTDFLTNGKRIVNLFENADETTFLHEVAHVMYDDLKKISELDEVAEKDLKTIDEWAEWNPGQIEEYRGTAWEKEFIRRDEAIRVAIKSENTAAEQALRAEWREERFARGFERYLEKGKAPTHVLQCVFDRAKRIFQNAYAAFRGNGGRPSPAVEGVMNRLLLSARKKETHEPITSQNRDDIVFEAMKILSKNVQRTEKEATKMRREFNHIIKGFTEVQDFLTYVKKNKTEICREMGFNQSARPDRNKESIKAVR